MSTTRKSPSTSVHTSVITIAASAEGRGSGGRAKLSLIQREIVSAYQPKGFRLSLSKATNRPDESPVEREPQFLPFRVH